ncbi:MAG: cytochrome c family protein, partial [Phycisphaerales bacterium]
PSETVAPQSPTKESEGAPLVLFLTGNELGSLRPCGCSGGQLGGLEKRTAIFDRVPTSRRLIVETGNLAAGEGEQDLIKFRVLFEGLRLLNYDMVCLTAQDVATAEHLGLLANTRQSFDLLKDQGGGPKVLSKRFSDRGLTVNVASFDPQNASVEQAAQLFGGEAGDSAVNILVLRSSDSGVLAELTAKAKGIDCIVCPTDVDEPHLLSEPGAAPVVVTAGRLGRHVCRLEVANPVSGGRPTLRFEDVPVTEDLPNDPALVQLYRQYQQLVAAANLLESYPRIPLPDGLSYAGSESCRPCHQAEFDEWITEGHADALNSLKKVGSDRDPECVICHVIGFEYEGGYVTEEKTPQFKDVGCENCHGPGSEHNESLGVKPTRGPKTSCLTCHTPEKSTGYAGHEEEYMQKIKHWREPAAAGNVKD